MPKRPSSPSSRAYRFRIGYEGEYYLMKKFTEKNQPGFYAVRTPGSGTGKMIKPDILAVDNGELYAIEVKSTNRGFMYVKPEQLKRIVIFSKLFEIKCHECGHKINPRPVLAVRFLGRGWVFKEIDDATKPIFIKCQESNNPDADQKR